MEEVEVAVVEVEEAEVVALGSPDQGQDLPHHHLLEDQVVGDYQDLVLLDLQVQNLPLHLLEDQAAGDYQDLVLLDLQVLFSYYLSTFFTFVLTYFR